MADVTLTTQQYLGIMRALATAMTFDDHVASSKGEKSDKELSVLWDALMNEADDFGMSFPEDKEEGDHWGDKMFLEVDEDLHALMDDEFWHLLASRMAEAQHAKTCDKQEGEHDEKCFLDVEARAEAIAENLDEEVFRDMVPGLESGIA